jgi:hypothetical protein
MEWALSSVSDLSITLLCSGIVGNLKGKLHSKFLLNIFSFHHPLAPILQMNMRLGILLFAWLTELLPQVGIY